jgi:chemotaxis protein CheC
MKKAKKMDIEKILKENPEQIDALREVGNIAASHCITALYDMMKEDIGIEVSDCRIMPVVDLPLSLEQRDMEVAAIFINVHGSSNAIMLMIFPKKAGRRISKILVDKKYLDQENVIDYHRDALCEIGNICLCAYLNAIAEFLKIVLIPTPPAIAFGPVGAIMQFPASLIGEKSNYAISMETNFSIKGESNTCKILFMPELNSQELILKRFNLETEMVQELRDGH